MKMPSFGVAFFCPRRIRKGHQGRFSGLPYPASSDGRSAELEAFWWLLEASRAEPSQLFVAVPATICKRVTNRMFFGR